MRIQLLSDLHLEFHRDNGAEFLEALDPSDVDVLVVAGDLAPVFGDAFTPAIEKLCHKYPQVVFVAGNHESYGTNIKDTKARLEAIKALFTNFRLLQNSVAEIEGVRFYGGTMWFPEPMDPAACIAKVHMNDFRAITDIKRAYDEHKEFTDNYRTAFSKEGGTPQVVVSHHLPTPESTPFRFRNSAINHFFCHDMRDAIAEFGGPKLWLHGHTHTPCDYMFQNTRVVANPFGYPGENRAYVDKLVLEA